MLFDKILFKFRLSIEKFCHLWSGRSARILFLISRNEYIANGKTIFFYLVLFPIRLGDSKLKAFRFS